MTCLRSYVPKGDEHKARDIAFIAARAGLGGLIFTGYHCDLQLTLQNAQVQK